MHDIAVLSEASKSESHTPSYQQMCKHCCPFSFPGTSLTPQAQYTLPQHLTSTVAHSNWFVVCVTPQQLDIEHQVVQLGAMQVSFDCLPHSLCVYTHILPSTCLLAITEACASNVWVTSGFDIVLYKFHIRSTSTEPLDPTSRCIAAASGVL